MSVQQIRKEESDKQYNQKALKSGFWYVFSEILVRGVSFFATPIYTRILPTAVFGNVRIFESWILILVPIISLSLYNSVERAKLDFREKYDAYISSIVTLTLILFASITLVFVIWKDTIKECFSFSESMFWIFPMYGCAFVCILCMQKRERQMLNYKSNILISFLSVLPSVILSITFLMLWKEKATDSMLTDIRILGFYIPLILLGVGVIVIIFLRGRTFVNLSYWRYGVAYSMPLIIYAVSVQVLYQSDKIMIQRMRGDALAGIYSLATTVVYIIDILSNALHGAWTPWLFEKLNRGEIKEVWRVWWILLIGMAVLSWGIVLFAPEAVWFLGGPKYKDAKWLLGSMLSAGVFQFVMLLFVALEKFYKKTRYSGWAGLISAGINISLNGICIYKFGYRAAAYTTAFSYLAAVVIHYLLIRRYMGKGNIPMNKMLLFCLGIWVVNMFSMFSYYAPIYIRICGISLLLLFFGFFTKGKIKRFLRQRVKERK